MPQRASSRALFALFVVGVILVATGFLVPGATVGVALIAAGAVALVAVAVAICILALRSGGSSRVPRG